MTAKPQDHRPVAHGRRPSVLATSILALLATGLVSASAQNLIVNGGFETGDFTGWTQFGNVSNTVVTTAAAFSGTYGGQFGPSGSTGGISQDFTTIPGDLYALSFFVVYNDGFPNSLSATSSIGTFSFAPSTPITYSANTLIGMANSTSGTLAFTFQDDGGSFYIDDISVTLAETATYWLGETNATWTANNWSSNSAATPITSIPNANTDVTFSASGAKNQNTTLGANFTIHSLTINDPAAVTINSGGANTLTIAGSPGTGITVNNSAGLFTLNANVKLAGFSDTISVSNTMGAVINGVIGGANGLIKAGPGTLTLRAVNNYTGATTVNDGVLQLGTTATAAALGAGQVNIAGGATLSLVNVSGNTFANNVTNPGSGVGTLAINSANPITLSGALTDGTGQLALTQSSTKTTILTNAGDSLYSGVTTVSNGILQIGTTTASSAIGTHSAVSIGTGGTLLLVNAGGNNNFLGNNISNTLGGTGLLNVDSAKNIDLLGTFSDGAGTLALKQSGTGSTVLFGASTYTGATTISGGTLSVQGSLANTVVAVNTGGTLEGKGTIAGPVTVNSGGTLATSGGGIAATLTVGALTLLGGSKVNYDLGASDNGAGNDLTVINGNLALAGTLNITAVGGFGAGTYDLFNYTGTLTGSTMSFGTLPAGFTAADFKIQTSVAHQVDLIVTGGPLVQYWNGSTTTANGTVHGGTGTWNNTTTNWTNAAGTANAKWAQSAAVFSTGSGTVSVGDNITVTTLGFAATAGAYTISVNPPETLTLNGAGVSNTSGMPQDFVTTVDGAGHVGDILFLNAATLTGLNRFTNNGAITGGTFGAFTAFENTASAGSFTQFINNGSSVLNTLTNGGGGLVFHQSATANTAFITNNPGTVSGADGGATQFLDSATASHANITNNGAIVGDVQGGGTSFSGSSTAANASINNESSNINVGGVGTTLFSGTSTAGSATIVNTGATVNGANGGTTTFQGTSTAGGATITNMAGTTGGGGGVTYFQNSADGGTARSINDGIFDISGLTDGGMKIGSIEGTGTFDLGGNTLTVGGNNLSTTVQGAISDGGVAGGTGGSLVKVGTGTLTLTGTNSYTGPTRVNAGTLQVGDGTTLSLPFGSGLVTLAGTATLVSDLPQTSLTGASIDLSAATTALKAIQTGHTDFTGVISGPGVFDQNGGGTTILSGTDTYTGATNVNAGTLQVGNGVAGNLAGASTVTVASFTILATDLGNGAIFAPKVNLNGVTATLHAIQSGTNTLSGVIGGTGFFEQDGTGTTILSNTETYTGSTIINAGTLGVEGALAAASAVSVGTAGTLTGKGTVHGPATLTGNGVIDFITSGNIAGTLGVTGGNWNGVGTVTGLVTSSTGTFTVNGSLTAPAGLAVTGWTIAGSGTITGKVNYTSSANSTFAGVIAGSASTVTMNNAASTLSLTGFNTYTGVTNVIAGDLEVDGLLAAASSLNVATAGTLSGTGTVLGKATMTGNGAIDFSADGTIAGTLAITGGNWNGVGTVGGLVTSSSGAFNIGSGANLIVVSALNVTGGTLTGPGKISGNVNYTSSASSTFARVIAGSGSTLTMNKAGATLILTGTNSFTGLTTINAGTLQLGDGTSGGVPGSSGITVTGSGILATDFAGTSTSAKNVSLSAAGATLKAIQSGTTTFTGLISGPGVFDQNGTGITILNNTETYTGNTNVIAGALRVAGSLAAGSTVNVATAGTLGGVGTILGKATLTGNGIIDFGTNGNIVGTLGVTGGNWNGVGSVGGLVTSSSGAFDIAGTLTASAGLNVTGGTIAGTGTLTGNLDYTSSASSTFAGIVGGAASTLTMNHAASTLTLIGNSFYGGATIVNAGTLQIGNGIATGLNFNSSGVTINTGGTLTTDLANQSLGNNIVDNGHVIALGTTNNYLLSSLISGTGNFTKSGSNVVTVNNTNTYKGGTTINGGTLLVNNATGSGTGTGPVTIGNGGTLGGSGTISGAATLNSGGIIEPGTAAPGTPGTTLHATSLLWNGGGKLTLQLGPAANDALALTGALTKGSAVNFTVDILDDGGISHTDYTLATFASTTFIPTNFTLELPGSYAGHLVVNATSLVLDVVSGNGQQPAQSENAADVDPTAPTPGIGFGPDSDTASSLSVTPTPEPTSAMLLAFGGAALLGWRRRRTI